MINEQTGSSEEGWLTLPEAATRLGIAVITLRRRLKEGAYEAKQIPGPHGPQWAIRLINEGPVPTRVIVAAHQVDQASNQPDQGQTDQADKSEQAEVDQSDKADQGEGDQGAFFESLRMMRELQEENRTLAGQVGFLQAQLMHSQSQLGQAQETLKALEASKTEAQEEARPWWRGWLRTLGQAW